ncbi:TonB-dependent receptor [Allosphingosinicella sp.]|uniref:TonB-dependent receptor n=1 Tax=Allosphingosinicella sp. TaxID=2823234 RepID=UPI003783C63C
MSRFRALLLTTALMPFAAFAQAAHAQDAVPATTPSAEGQQETQVAAADQPAPSTSPDNQGLGDIVVTATRRETNLQRTPIAISVLSPQALSNRHVQSLYDLADGAVPSLRVATFEARQSALTVGIRGIVPFDANQTARDQGVGIYIDGVYLGRQQGLNAALFDIERIEVLRGPQGTLFGRNTEGGAVSMVTHAPTGVFGVRASVGVGNFGSYTGQVHVDLPAIGNISIKLDGVVQHQDATIENPLAGQYGWNYYHRVGGRIAIRWQPFDGFTADFAYDRARDQNTPFYSQLVNYNPQGRVVGVYNGANQLVNPNTGLACNPACIAQLSPLVVVSGDRRMEVADIGVPQQPSVDDTDGFSAVLRYHASPAVELRSITAWRGVDTHQWDNSGGGHRTIFAPNANFSRYSLSELFQSQFSQEFQIVGSIPHLDYVFGLYYFNEHAQEAAATPSTNRWNATGTGYTINSELVIPPVTSGNQGWDRASWFVQRGSRAEAQSYSAFGQVTWSPTEAIHVTVGGRYSRDERDGVLYTVQNKPTNFLFTFRGDRFDPLITLAADVMPGVNLYAKYATGYRAGGANDRSQTFNAFGPEVVKSYEVGAKLDLFDRHVRLNLAGYIMNRTGTQTDFDNVDTNPASPTFNLHTEETLNAPGTSKIRGFEAELTARVTQDLTLGLSYAYTHARVPPTPNPFLPGNPLFPVFVVFTPRNALSGSLDYNVPVGGQGAQVRLHLDANYADPQYSFQAESVRTDSSFIVNGRIALADVRVGPEARVTFSLWSRNLLNETHIYRRSAANAAVLGDYANFNAPRTFGAEIGFAF